MILLDYKDRRPIYEQIVEKLKDLMICGVFGSGQPAAFTEVWPQTYPSIPIPDRELIWSLRGEVLFNL